MLDGEPSFTKSAQKRLNKEVLYSQVLEEVHSTPQEATQEGQGRGQRKATHAAHFLIRVR